MNKRELSIDEKRAVFLEGMKEFTSFCDRHNLKYYLIYGTLLGAVRHQGFIPWDDDVDLCMPREDYDKLINDYSVEILSDNWQLMHADINPKYKTYWAKFCNRKTIVTPSRFINGFLYGLSIDIFPLDSVSMTESKDVFSKEFIRISDCYQRRFGIYYANRKSCSIPKLLVKKVLYALATIRFGKYYKHIVSLSEVFRKTDISKSHWLCIFGEKPVFKSGWFRNTKNLSFEGQTFKVPAEYDSVLREQYGDYMEFPPIEKRVGQHSYKAYWI